MKAKIFILACFIILCFVKCRPDQCGCGMGRAAEYDELKGQCEKIKQLRKKVNHIIVIYQENWSFDGLYGKFPGANNLSSAHAEQVDRNDSPFHRLLHMMKPDTAALAEECGTWIPDPKYIKDTIYAGKPYDLARFIPDTSFTGDITHLFYTEQLQIDNGRMDKFAAYSQNEGLVQGYYDATNLPEGLLAQQYTICDNFFHSAFGGSFLNHIWFISAASPEWKTAPYNYICKPGDSCITKYDNKVTTDGYAVNTSFSVNTPRPKLDPSEYVPYQKNPTIGDRMSDAGVSWVWYAGGWNDALAGNTNGGLFQYHHQPFIYFERYKDSSENKARHLKDETEFYAAIANNTLPEVSFIKCLGRYDEHPNYSNLMAGQMHVDSLVKMVMNSKYWDDCVIIIAYDEHGGRWDHVAPPKIDKWGPGSRVPCIIISKYARKKYVDHTQYETVSIIKFIETRYGLHPLTTRDSLANGMLNAFEF